MTDAIEPFGPEIKRDAAICGGHWPPKWLGADFQWCPTFGGGWFWPREKPALEWNGITAVRVKHTHPASIAQRWNDDNPGEKPWDRPHLGGGIPSDYGGGSVLLRGPQAVKGAHCALKALGLIRETPVERFKRENPGLSADELLEKALAR